MIDLHIHTSLSDGAFSIDEIIEFVNKLDITYISITDHNHALAYEKQNLSKLNNFKSHIITGCEIATSYEGYIIEILGYGVKPDIINSWYRDFYSDENLKKNEIWLFNKLKKLCIKENLKIEDDISLGEIKKGCSKRVIYKSLIKFKENLDVMGTKSYHDFLRLMLYNPKHSLFLNEAETYPSLKDVVDLIHHAKGLAFLAHPFEYAFDNTFEIIENILKLVSLDGIECFHPSATVENSHELECFCKGHSLYISGGSDFHNFKRNIGIGLSSNNLPINDELIIPWLKENMLIK
ncbi:PHP domain-containing protein [Caloramator sp. E03]|uniref:PHP domain-containing protein n=1 Tax=Caloramator sp. E03 TaxID=2576307 RepID=UPI0011105F32|nr:PHP domain-containing protein [Caloramator sp. E03]QCX34326.1 PHP domain-containing protein [Caloramator sp. E03]